MAVINYDEEPAAPLTLEDWLENRRRMLLSEIEWIERSLHIRPRTSELRHTWKSEKSGAKQEIKQS